MGHPLYHFPVHKSMGDALVLISRSICFASKQTTLFPSRSHTVCVYVCMYACVCVFALVGLVQRIPEWTAQVHAAAEAAKTWPTPLKLARVCVFFCPVLF